MSATFTPAIILLSLAIAGIFGLRRYPRLRIGFDAVCFLAASLYFYSQSTFPVFPPLGGPRDSSALGLRGVGAAWWLLGSRLLVAGLWLLHRRDQRSRGTRLFSDLAAAAIYIATGAIVLNSVFALPLAGLVATSGVVAIVLGLALQNTLADVFSGIAVGIETPFQVGDRVQIGERIEGQVVQINWRSIRVQTDGDDIAIIPNSQIAKAEIINRSWPTQRRSGSVELSCPHQVLPERVIQTLCDATLLCPDILRTPAPRAVLTRLGAKRSSYRISFVVDGTGRLAATTDLLLRGARRQLHYAGLLVDAPAEQPLALQLLRDAVIFECLDEGQLSSLAARLDDLRLEPNENLFIQGVTDDYLYIVASGIISVTRSLGPLQETLGFIGAGEYLGEIGLLTGAPHAATAVSATYCHVFRLGRDALAPLLKDNVHLAAAFDKSVRHGLERLNRSVAARSTPTLGPEGQLLQRIRNLFHLGPG